MAAVLWRSFGVDEKKHSPMLVSVDREGLFGFRVVASSGAGVTGRPPQSGDHPEVWIGVDLTRPVGHITPAAPGSGPERDKLVITWEASDQMLLAARPITLALAENRNGPWHMIATDLENTGRFAWATDSRLPLRAFLQLRIRDEAGNVGQYETSEPVSLDHSNPVAHIRECVRCRRICRPRRCGNAAPLVPLRRYSPRPFRGEGLGGEGFA